MSRARSLIPWLGVVLLVASLGLSTGWAAGASGLLQPAPPQDVPPPEPPTFSDSARPGAESLWRDSFGGGRAHLPWRPFPFFNRDNLRGALDPTSPTPDHGVGVLSNENVGGFAALSYVEEEVPADFYLEGWVYLAVSEGEEGPLNGLAFRVDPVEGRFYRLASHFTSDPSVTLAYVGRDTNNFPVYLATWKGENLPGGLPTESGWHRLGIRVIDGGAEVYWDGVRLPGEPVPIDRVHSGFVGVYANYVGGLGHAETRVDDLQLWSLTP